MGQLRIETGAVDLPVEVRDKQFQLVGHGLASDTYDVAPGDYVVSTQLPGSQRVVAAVQVSHGEVVDVDLQPDYLQIAPRDYLQPAAQSAGAGAGLEPLGYSGTEADSTSDVRVGSASIRWGLRLYDGDGLSYRASKPDGDPLDIEESGGSTVRVRIRPSDEQSWLIQAQVVGQVPLNVRLPTGPGDKECELTASLVGDDVILGAYPSSPTTQLAARYLAAGEVSEGSIVIDAAHAEKMLYRKMVDPLGAAIGGYLLLRAGDLDRLHDWPDNLARQFPWLPDGAIIAAETAALRGDFIAAVEYLTMAVERGLPIFTDGYSLLVSRLRQLGRREEQLSRSAGAPPSSTTVERAASKLLSQSLAWAPFIDYAAPTLTFRAADPSDPAASQTQTDELATDVAFRGTVEVRHKHARLEATD